MFFWHCSTWRAYVFLLKLSALGPKRNNSSTFGDLLFEFVFSLLLHAFDLVDLAVKFASLLHKPFLHFPFSLLHLLLGHLIESLLLHYYYKGLGRGLACIII